MNTPHSQEDERQKWAAQLEALYQVSLELTAELDLDALLQSIVSRAIELLGAEAGGLYLYRPERDILEWVVAIGTSMVKPGFVLRKGEGLSGKVWETGEPLIVDDYQHWEGRLAAFKGYPWTSVLGVPIRWGEEFLGVLNVLGDRPRTLSHPDARLLSLLAGQAAIAIRNAAQHDQMRKINQELEREIIERKRAEAALRESEARFRTIFEKAAIGIALTDAEGRFLETNPALQAMRGYTADELRTMDFGKMTHPDDLAKDVAMFRELVAGKRDHYQMEKRYIRKDRQIVWGRLTVSLVRDADGKPQFAIGMVEDITQRKQAEEALRDSEARFRTIFEEAGIGIALTDLEGRLVETNPALQAMHGYTGDELRQMSFADVTHPDDVAADAHLFNELISGQRDHYWLAKRYIRKDGQWRWGQLTVSAVRDGKGQPRFAIGMVEDVTERKLAQDALAQAHDELERRVAERTAELATKNTELQAEIAVRHRLLDRVRVGQARMQQLAQQVVTAQEEERRRLSRALHDEAGQTLIALTIKLNMLHADTPAQARSLRQGLREAADLANAMSERLRLLAHGLRPPGLDTIGLSLTIQGLCRDFSRHAGLAIEYVGDEPPSLSDEVSICLYRYVQEALANVARHSGAKNVRVTLGHDAEAVNLTVMDDGQGFDPRSLKSSPDQHMGIGLLGMRERLSLLGGCLEIDSRPGQGACLVARIPINDLTAETEVTA